jgi:hypothetical protein
MVEGGSGRETCQPTPQRARRRCESRDRLPRPAIGSAWFIPEGFTPPRSHGRQTVVGSEVKLVRALASVATPDAPATPEPPATPQGPADIDRVGVHPACPGYAGSAGYSYTGTFGRPRGGRAPGRASRRVFSFHWASLAAAASTRNIGGVHRSVGSKSRTHATRNQEASDAVQD